MILIEARASETQLFQEFDRGRLRPRDTRLAARRQDHAMHAGITMTARREAGEEQAAPVPCDEGIANRIGPEPCVVGREAGGDANDRVDAAEATLLRELR